MANVEADNLDACLRAQIRQRWSWWNGRPDIYLDNIPALTSLPIPILCDLVRDLGLEPPTNPEADEAWLAWWQHAGTITETARDTFLAALDLAQDNQLIRVDLCEGVR